MKLTIKLAWLTLSIMLLFALVAAGCANKAAGSADLNIDVSAPGSTQSMPADGQSGTQTSLAPTPDPNMPANTISIDDLDGTEDATATPEPRLTYSEYRELNSDVIGWIRVDDTNVDYPLLQSHDNEDYLTRSPSKSASKSGSIFLDYRCSPSSSHMIVYGHNMSKSKTMFAQITNYGNRSFYDAHRTFEVTFGDKKYTYKVFAVYSVDVNEVQYMAVEFDSGAQFAEYMNKTLAPLSQFPIDTTIGESDQVITLSTCKHTDYANGRFVVHAVRVD